MDTNTTAQALERAFARDIEDGTVEVRREDSASSSRSESEPPSSTPAAPGASTPA